MLPSLLVAKILWHNSTLGSILIIIFLLNPIFHSAKVFHRGALEKLRLDLG